MGDFLTQARSRFDSGRTAEPLTDRIRRLSLVDNDGCWIWQGPIDKRWGYGKMKVGSRRDGTRREAKAHRVSYEAFVGPIPAGMTIDHLCNVRACVNPDHLQPMTMRENTMKPDSASPSAIHARQTHCVHGHEFDQVDPKGYRRCGTCAKRRAAAQRANRVTY